MTAYYIDFAGDDSNNGLSIGTAWKTGGKVSDFSASPGFAPGDHIVFTAGQVFQGGGNFVSSGTAGNYISIGTGRGTTPARIPQSNPAVLTALSNNGFNLNDCEYVWIDNLAFVGIGVDTSTGVTSSIFTGISLKSTQTTNKLRANRITACTVTGTQSGIVAITSNGSDKGYDDLQIWGCSVFACQNLGIFSGDIVGPGNMTQNANIYIGNCQVYDLPGYTVDNVQGGGCWVNNCTTGTVENCVVHDIQNGTGTGRGRTDEFGSPGFIAIMCDGVVFQYNEAYLCRSNSVNYDGEGFDIEPSSINCVFQYNYAHDNDGCGFSFTGATVRFNVSANNCKNPSAISGNPGQNFSINAELVQDCLTGVDSLVYGNTVYATGSTAAGLLAFGGSGTTKTLAYNNIFVVQSGALSISAWTLAAIGNSYFLIGGSGVSARIQSTSTTYGQLSDFQAAGYEKNAGINYGTHTDPLLDNPVNSPVALPANPVATVTNYDIANNSPAVNEGIDYSLLSINPGSVDFHNVPCLFRNAGSQQQELAVWHMALARMAA